jgi:hypothetical protein
MLFRLTRWYRQSNFNNSIARIWETPTIDIVDKPWTLISMISTRDIPMYLLAMKSFYTRLGGGKIIAIIDRDMPAESRAILTQHFRGIQFLILEDIDVGKIQRGGTWERLLTLVRQSEKEYVIQIDADILTVGNIDEIIECVQQNRSFTMNGQTGFPIWDIEQSIAEGHKSPSDHCSIAFERALAQYPDKAGKYYVRGSSGLVGLAKGCFSAPDLEQFHVTMTQIMGKRWLEWGTEQVGSNWVVANSPNNALVLPYPKYANFFPALPRHKSNALHFIGTYRYDEGHFAKLGQVEIQRLIQLGRQNAA